MHLIAPAPHATVRPTQPRSRRRATSRATRAILLSAFAATIALAPFALTARHAAAAPTLASQTAPASTNAQFPLIVHVTASFWDINRAQNTIDATIDSVRYELRSNNHDAFLAPGDYPARIVKGRSKLPSYWVSRTFELQFPDGKTANFLLSGQWAQ